MAIQKFIKSSFLALVLLAALPVSANFFTDDWSSPSHVISQAYKNVKEGNKKPLKHELSSEARKYYQEDGVAQQMQESIANYDFSRAVRIPGDEKWAYDHGFKYITYTYQVWVKDVKNTPNDEFPLVNVAVYCVQYPYRHHPTVCSVSKFLF